MFQRRERQAEDERLDHVGRQLIRAANDEEAAERAASAPFLYARVRARISAEQARGTGAGEEGWLALLSISRRAVPALSGVAALALALTLWLAGVGTITTTTNAPASLPLSDEALFDARDTSVEQAVLNRSQNLSRDDVLSIVVARDEQGTQSR